jgi:hypothetical protein
MKPKSKISARFNWMLFAVLSALVDDTTRKQIEYLIAETQVLRTQLRKATGRKRIFLTDDQRRLLAVKAKAIGSKALAEITDLFSPATILGWYSKLVAKKYDGSNAHKTGRKRTDIVLVELALKLAKDNPDWGSLRIAHMMTYLGHKISGCTVRRIMRDNGIDPDREYKKKLTWDKFIKSHMHVMMGCDFFQVEVFTLRGLVRCSVLFFLELNSRRVHIVPSVVNPTSQWVDQQIKNHCNFNDGIFDNRTYLIHDRDPLFTAEKVQDTLETSGVKSVKIAPCAPDQNAFCESWVATCRREILDKMVFTSKKQLDSALAEFETYYNRWRVHSGLNGNIIDPLPQDEDGEIVCHEFIGGLLKGYRRVKKSLDIAA